MLTRRVETILAQSDANTVLRAGTIDRRELGRFARAVSSLDELAPAIGTALAQRLEPGETIRQIIAAPRQLMLGTRRGKWDWLAAWLPWELTPDWVLVLAEDRVLVATVCSGSAPVVASTAIADMLSFELGKILLRAWVEWTFPSQGRVEHTRIYFNAVSERIFKEALEYMRRNVAAGCAPSANRCLEYLADLPYKFKNIISHQLLLPDEQVQAAIYQPFTWAPRLYLLRHQQSAAMALVLTDRHVLIAEEEMTGRPDNCGLIARFLPRSRIQHVALEQEQARSVLRLTLAHQGAEQQVRIPFEAGAQAQLDKLAALMQGAGLAST
jgi:hypothetical protein